MDDRAAYAAVIGKLILTLRTMRGMNQESLAVRASLSQSALSRFENGQTLPDAFELRKVAEALGYKPEQLVTMIEQAFARTRDAAKNVKKATPWVDIAVAGAFAGLAVGVIASLLNEAEQKNGRKKP